MLYCLEETEKVSCLFAGWEETLIWSCVQKVMGKIYVTDLENPHSACAFVGCFAFYAGIPNRELVLGKPKGYVIMAPQNEAWAELIESCCPEAQRATRYAICKGTKFDRKKLEALSRQLPAGYSLRLIDGSLYEQCLAHPQTMDFVAVFGSKEAFLRDGLGVVCMKDGRIVAGASSYTRYREGIEIEVDTLPEERQKGLAAASCARLILDSLDRGLYPSWDAQNLISVHLAEKLGYTFSHTYPVYICKG